jgi:hypothetical protein
MSRLIDKSSWHKQGDGFAYFKFFAVVAKHGTVLEPPSRFAKIYPLFMSEIVLDDRMWWTYLTYAASVERPTDLHGLPWLSSPHTNAPLGILAPWVNTQETEPLR